MPDLTLDEYRGLLKEELREILKQEARKISGKPLSEIGTVKTPVIPTSFHGARGQRGEKRFGSGFLLGFFSIFRPKTNLSTPSMETNLRP
jgi:hypothetical protein